MAYEDVKELAGRLGVTTATIYNYVRRGILPRPIKLGNSTRFVTEEVDAALAKARRFIPDERTGPSKRQKKAAR